jgi:hypothetical protein
MEDEKKLPEAVFAPEMGIVVISIKEYEHLKEVEWMYKDLQD